MAVVAEGVFDYQHLGNINITALVQQNVEYEQVLKKLAEENARLTAENHALKASISNTPEGETKRRDTVGQLQRENLQLKEQLHKQSDVIKKALLSFENENKDFSNQQQLMSTAQSAVLVQLNDENELLTAQLRVYHEEVRRLRTLASAHGIITTMPENAQNQSQGSRGPTPTRNRQLSLDSQGRKDSEEEDVQVNLVSGRVYVRMNGQNVSMEDYLNRTTNSFST
eukprot:TRINITY_DN71438_c0_g1_i1.p1 TRINITY_DN71438_c0_g1~~TRINITY_DN71438_c0_g1_i1.p1  ORF type:complete len:226 (-),score=31.40 TRINITY_DN71438_c0_g1_i1:181-858(-)